VELFADRVWRVDRPAPDWDAMSEAIAVVRSARRPLLVAGGGLVYSEATEALRVLVDATGIPVAETQAGKGSLPYDHPSSVGAIGATGTTAANRVAAGADVVIGVGTRYSDFTTASRTVFADPAVRFVNLNVARVDSVKHAGVSVVTDARAGLQALGSGLRAWSVAQDYRDEVTALAGEWDRTVERAYHLGNTPLPAQSEVIGAVNEASEPHDVVVCAAGSMPGDLHKLWRTRDPKGYHAEYGYSCMGYEIAGGIGVRMAAPDRDVFVLVGDGSFLMMAQELVTAVAERVKVIVVLVQNHGFASIGALSESLGSQRFGTRYRYRDPETGRLDGDPLPVDLAANAESLGVRVLRATGVDELRKALRAAKEHEGGPVLVHVETDPLVGSPDSEAWWDVPVSEVAELDSSAEARAGYEQQKKAQRTYLRPSRADQEGKP
jgi:3D-(3,5/4)-trihydroxycyclohexane-1,2-dione acylhydrolase (decyclizing)